MKKAKRTILYTLCLCTALLGFSCTKEMETEEHPAMPDVPCRVEFRIETEAATRATDHAVRNLNFYVYGNSGLVRSGYDIGLRADHDAGTRHLPRLRRRQRG